MRVLFWTGNFWPRIGGTAIFADKILPALHRLGHDCIVVAPKSSAEQPDQEQFHGIPVYRFPFWHNRTFSDIDHLMNTLKLVSNLKKDFSPDIVHISGVDIGNFFHLETVHAHPTPTLVTVHDSQMQDNQDNPIPALDTLMGRAPNLIHKSNTIYNGHSQPRIVPAALPTNPPNLLCCGRLVYRKGFDIALNIFASLLKRHSALKVTIAGDGPELSILKSRAQSLGMRDRITFLGWVGPDQVASVMNEATIVLMPSRREPFGLVALEAALMGRPIVATRVGGLQEIVVHQQTGLLVENEDIQGLETATEFLLTNLDIASTMGKAARGRALQHFSLTQCVESYDRLYQELVTQFQLKNHPNFGEVFTHP